MTKRDSVPQSVTNATLDLKLSTLTETVTSGFKGVHERQDIANGRTATNEKELASLRGYIEKEFAIRDAKSKYNRFIWYTLTTAISVIIALSSFIVLK